MRGKEGGTDLSLAERGWRWRSSSGGCFSYCCSFHMKGNRGSQLEKMKKMLLFLCMFAAAGRWLIGEDDG